MGGGLGHRPVGPTTVIVPMPMALQQINNPLANVSGFPLQNTALAQPQQQRTAGPFAIQLQPVIPQAVARLAGASNLARIISSTAGGARPVKAAQRPDEEW